MCSFITQHNATDVASFEGVCNWHADCRNVHQRCCPWIECSFLYHKPSPKAFQRIWQYIQPASQPQTTCNHTSPGPPHPASFTSKIVWDQSPGQLPATICLHNQRISAQNCQKPSQGSSSACSSSSSGSRPDLQFVVVTNLSGQMLTFDGVLALWRGFLFTDESRFSLYRADGRQRVWRRVGWAVCWCQRCGSSGPWWRWGYGMGRHWWHFECTKVPWRDPEAHCCAIHPRPSPHVAAW